MLFERLPETTCTLRLWWLYLSLNISVILMLLSYAVCSGITELGCVLDELYTEVQYVPCM